MVKERNFLLLMDNELNSEKSIFECITVTYLVIEIMGFKFFFFLVKENIDLKIGWTSIAIVHGLEFAVMLVFCGHKGSETAEFLFLFRIQSL